MSEKRLMEILQELYDQELTPEEVFPIFESLITEED